MRSIITIILFSFTLSSIYPIHEKFEFSLDDEVDFTFKNSLLNEENTHFSRMNLKAMLFSAVLPGSGEYLMGHRNRAYFFLGLEALAIGTWYTYKQKGLNTQDEYRAFADIHWSLDRWFYDYYKWSSSDNEFHYNFVKDCAPFDASCEEYPEIWEDSHHLNFTINGNFYSSNSDEFEQLYENYEQLYTQANVELFFEENVVTVEKDHHYYENIGKYDHFYAGWDDNDSLYVVVKELGGEYIAMSPNKREYREIWDNSNNHYRIASYALSSMVANHFASILDVLFLSKLNNNKIMNLSAKTYYSPLNLYGIGGIELSFNWD